LGGVRVEKNSWHATNKGISAATLREEVRSNGKDYTEVLPGIHFRHELRKNLILRESYNRSYGRPKIGNLTLGRTTDANGNISEGNQRLNATTYENFDVQREQYTQSGGLYSIRLYYQQRAGFDCHKRFTCTNLDANGAPIRHPFG